MKRSRVRGAVTAVLAIVAALALAGCAPADATRDGTDSGEGTGAGALVRVPQDVSSLREAAASAKPGDLILVSEGNYAEEVLIRTPDVTVRGVDRNAVVIDGEGKRPYGIVAMADGVRVENLTVTGATFYGLLFTGLHDETGPSAPSASGYKPWNPADFPPLQRFLADHVTATNNGLYGIYAFNAQHGAIVNSYASGSADSGLYVGQCTNCDILVAGNVAERNAVGFENSNASDSVVIVGNRFTQNRMGITLLSSYQEAFLPQRGNEVVGNLIADNVAELTPAQANGGFGTGIGLSGGVQNVVSRNLISGHSRAGVLLRNSEDLPAEGNAFLENAFSGNAADLVNASAARAAAVGNCVLAGVDLPATVFLPEALGAETLAASCGEVPAADGERGLNSAVEPDWPAAPRGMSFREVALPKAQPNLFDGVSVESLPTRLPKRIDMPDLGTYGVPSPTLLQERAGTA